MPYKPNEIPDGKSFNSATAVGAVETQPTTTYDGFTNQLQFGHGGWGRGESAALKRDSSAAWLQFGHGGWGRGDGETVAGSITSESGFNSATAVGAVETLYNLHYP